MVWCCWMKTRAQTKGEHSTLILFFTFLRLPLHHRKNIMYSKSVAWKPRSTKRCYQRRGFIRTHLLASLHRSKSGDSGASITVSWWRSELILTPEGSIAYTPISSSSSSQKPWLLLLLLLSSCTDVWCLSLTGKKKTNNTLIKFSQTIRDMTSKPIGKLEANFLQPCVSSSSFPRALSH